MEAGDLVADKRQRRGAGFFILRFAWTGARTGTSYGPHEGKTERGEAFVSLAARSCRAGRVRVGVVDAAREG
jgi:hypothetical protein